LKERLRGPAHERDRIVPGELGHVDEPNNRFNADGGADAEHELAELLVGELTADAVERLGDPPTRRCDGVCCIPDSSRRTGIFADSKYRSG
jgi:hypothetical protein